jgi:glycosyltransferase involved in cell wall biosynthesis
VLCFADTRFPIERANGVQTMATCHALARRGHDVTLVVRPDNERVPRDPFAFYGLPPVETLHVRAVAAGAGTGTRRARFLLAAAQIVATDHGNSLLFTRDLGLASWLARMPRRQRLPLVYESHGVADVVAAEMPALLGKPELAPSARKLDRLARREKRVWARASAYVTLTQALADELSTRFGPRPDVFVVPDAATYEDRAAPVSETPFIAGYAGHLYPWKGVDLFVQALAATPDIHGLIVGGHPGEADLARVRQLVTSLGLDDRVTITGLVAPKHVRVELSLASVLVLPNTASAISARYTSPLKLFEYLTLGRPIVASDSPAIREVLEDRFSALLVPPGDAPRLATALMELRDDAALRQSLGDAAAALAPSYTWDERAKRLEAALQAAGSP